MCFFCVYSWFCFHTQVAFKAQLSTNSESIVLLDDVSVQTGACSPRGSCDFESGKCTWVNVANGVTDGRDWIHADGHYRGPLVDYTTHTADGESLLLYLLCLLILQTFFTSQMIYQDSCLDNTFFFYFLLLFQACFFWAHLRETHKAKKLVLCWSQKRSSLPVTLVLSSGTIWMEGLLLLSHLFASAKESSLPLLDCQVWLMQFL